MWICCSGISSSVVSRGASCPTPGCSSSSTCSSRPFLPSSTASWTGTYLQTLWWSCLSSTGLHRPPRWPHTNRTPFSPPFALLYYHITYTTSVILDCDTVPSSWATIDIMLLLGYETSESSDIVTTWQKCNDILNLVITWWWWWQSEKTLRHGQKLSVQIIIWDCLFAMSTPSVQS